MIPKNLLLIILSSFTVLLKAQTIKNVTSEQDGNNINIFYDITGYKNYQEFSIVILCETETKKFILKNISGDIGDHIKGGAHKKIIWDVFKEIDSLGTAKFIVRIDKIYDTRNKNNPVGQKNYTYLKRGFSFGANTGISLLSGTYPCFDLFAGYHIIPELLIGAGVGYQKFNIGSTIANSYNTGIPNYNVSSFTDSFTYDNNIIRIENAYGIPVYATFRYYFSDNKITPYIFSDIGMMIGSTVSYNYTRRNLPAYDSVGFFTSGSSPDYAGYVSNDKLTEEQINPTVSFKNNLYLRFGAGAKYALTNKLFLTFDLSYTYLKCEYEVNNQFLFHSYEYLDPAELTGHSDPPSAITYDVVLHHKSQELKDQITSESKNLSSLNLKIGLLF